MHCIRGHDAAMPELVCNNACSVRNLLRCFISTSAAWGRFAVQDADGGNTAHATWRMEATAHVASLVIRNMYCKVRCSWCEQAQCASKPLIKYMLACVCHLPCHSWNQSAFVKVFRRPNCGHCSVGPPMMPHGEQLLRMQTQMPVGCCAPYHVPLTPSPTACNALPCTGLAY